MATEYISREAALDFLIPTDDLNISKQDQRIIGDRFEEFLKDIPTADVQPVIHGRWIPMTYIRELTENGWPNCRWEKAIEPDSVDGLMCSECGEIFDFEDARNFCTQCGANMRGMKDCES